jgi:hypothetical protein
MSLNRIQKTFVRLATNQQSFWSQLGRHKTKRRVYVYNKKWQPNKVTVGIINAVTGEKTTAKAFEESAPKLKKWLKLRNVRAEFTDMLLKKRSTFFKLTGLEWIDYPIIIQVGTYRCPYLIKRIQDRVVRKGRVTCSIQLETINNVDYLQLIYDKKELLKKEKKHG